MQVLNAMLLACCSNEANTKDSCNAALQAIEALLDAGAVPDTWAPNGNSVRFLLQSQQSKSSTVTDIFVRQGNASRPFVLQALMMAASADSPATIALLLKKNAQINMKVRIRKCLAYSTPSIPYKSLPGDLYRIIPSVRSR